MLGQLGHDLIPIIHRKNNVRQAQLGRSNCRIFVSNASYARSTNKCCGTRARLIIYTDYF